MLEGKAVEARSQKVSEKAVPAAVDIPGTLVEKTPFSASPAISCFVNREGCSMEEKDSQNKHSGCWSQMIATDIISLILPLLRKAPIQDQPGKKQRSTAPRATRELYFSAVQSFTCG